MIPRCTSPHAQSVFTNSRATVMGALPRASRSVPGPAGIHGTARQSRGDW